MEPDSARKTVALSIAIVVALGMIAVRVVSVSRWGLDHPLVPLWGVILLAIAFVGLVWIGFDSGERLKSVDVSRTFAQRYLLNLSSASFPILIMVVFPLAAAELGGYFSVILAASMIVLLLGLALVSTGVTNPNPQIAKRDGSKSVGGRNYKPMWGVIAAGIAVMAGSMWLALGVPDSVREWDRRVVMASVKTDTLIRATTDDNPGYREDDFFTELLSRDLSASQRERLAVGLLDQFSAHEAMPEGALAWFERQLADATLPEAVVERYESQVDKVFDELHGYREPLSEITTGTLIRVATTGWPGSSEEDCLVEALARPLSNAERIRLAEALLDQRLDQERLPDTAVSWLESEIGAGSLPERLQERYFGEMFEVWFEGERRVEVNQPYEVALASRYRHYDLRSAFRVRVYFAGLSTDGGETWTPRDPCTDSGSGFGTRSYRREEVRRNIMRPRDVLPQSVRFSGVGDQVILARLWVAAIPNDIPSLRINWLPDGSPELPPGTAWSKRIELHEPVRVTPPASVFATD